MTPPRWRIWLMLAPTLAVILILFGGGLLYGLLQSLGWNPRIGLTELSLEAYRNILVGDEIAPLFWAGLRFTFWISIASTVLSAIVAVLLALTIHSTQRGKQFAAFLLQFNLPIPHLVAAIGALFLLSQSGLIARFAAMLGLISTPADFPLLVRDPSGTGIIIAYVWKEVPFVGVIVLAVLQALGDDYKDSARNLGANRWQRFRYVTLPLMMPALLSASVIVFAFTFGAYEVPQILGVRFPQALPVLSLRFFNNPDLSVRAEAMALSIIVSLIVVVSVIIYMILRDRAQQDR